MPPVKITGGLRLGKKKMNECNELMHQNTDVKLSADFFSRTGAIY